MTLFDYNKRLNYYNKCFNWTLFANEKQKKNRKPNDKRKNCNSIKLSK